MKTTVSLLVLFILILGGGYALYAHNHPATSATQTEGYSASVSASSTPNTSSIATTSAGAATQPASGSYTATQVAAHNTSKDCWSSINGNVYDLTSWISQHPGGEAAILTICGKDGSQAFNQQHGRARDTQPKDILATFKIGTLTS